MLCSIASSIGSFCISFIGWIIGDISGVGSLDIGETSEVLVNSDKEFPDSGKLGFPLLLVLHSPPVHSLH